MGWVLADTDAALQVFQECDVEIENPEYMVGTWEAYMGSLIDEQTNNDRPVGTLNQWLKALDEALVDANWQGNDVDSILSELKRKQALQYVKPDPLYPGAPVLALLAEDSEWHPAILEEIKQHGDMSVYHVVFTEYGKPQVCEKESLVAMSDVPGGDEDGVELGVGECELCRRTMDMTFHHLIPKETHKRYLKKKKLPANLNPNDVVRSAKGDMADKNIQHCKNEAVDTSTSLLKGTQKRVMLKVECTTLFLNSYGASLCRPCHSFIHSVADNEGLAEHYNTIELLESNEKVGSWIRYAAKQRITQKRQKKVVRKQVTFDDSWNES